ncbi:MAG TPA: dTDP-glucose 4,6-dehydratase [Terriglobales bacterium]|nr:dTDP-glucose 4,6-dehydratase [Terriglobales bacterium]
MKVVVTGGAGFIGSNFVHLLLRERPGCSVVVVDKLTYAGCMENLREAAVNPRFSFVKMDICAPEVADAIAGADVVVNFAAETHVDRSIEDAAAFVRTNVEGTWRLLESARAAKVARFIQIGTDEVYGSLGPSGKFREDTPLAPRSPYSSTKAAADMLALAYTHTHNLPVIVTRCSNNYGPYQFPEKFIPVMVLRAMRGDKLPVYGDGLYVRDWLHVEDHCRAILTVMERGREGEVYNIGGDCERENIHVAKTILEHLGRGHELIEFVQDRPGHDRRYAIDCEKTKSELGWRQRWNFENGLLETIAWYKTHTDWVEQLERQNREYFKRHYEDRPAVSAGR